MGRGKREGTSKYNLRGDSWFAVQGEGDEQHERRHAVRGSNSPAAIPSNQSREKHKGAVPLRGDPEEARASATSSHDASSGTASSSQANIEPSFGAGTSAPYSPEQALTELLDRFGRWGGLGLDAEVIEAVLVQLGGDRDAAAELLLELAGGASGDAPGTPGTASGRHAVAASTPGSPAPAAGSGQDLRTSGSGQSSSGSSGVAAFDPGRPEGADLWQLLPLECQERILTSVDVRHLSGLAASCRQCCEMVRQLRSRVRRLSIPSGLNALRAAGLVHAHWRATELSFKPCCKTFSEFTTVFAAAASPPPPHLVTHPDPFDSEPTDNTDPDPSAPASPAAGTGTGRPPGTAAARQPPRRSLASVNLSGCAHLRDEDVRVLLRLHPRITHLDLSHCPLLTDNTLMLLAEYPFREEGKEGGEEEEGVMARALQDPHSQGQYRDFPSGTMGDHASTPGGRGSLLAWRKGQGLTGGGPGEGRAGAGQAPLVLTRMGNGALMLRPANTEGEGATSSSFSTSATTGTSPGTRPHLASHAEAEPSSSSASSTPPCSALFGRKGARVGSLEVLSIAGCGGMTDDGLAALLHGKGVKASLRQLDMSRCARLGPWLRHFPGKASAMETLVAASLPRLTEPLQLTSLSQRLRTLSLAHCTALPTLTLHLRSLRSLSLDACSSLTRASLACPGLTTLSASNCKDLTTLTTGPCPELKSLRLAHCRELSHASVTALVNGAPALEELDLSSCNKLISLVLRGLSHRALRFLMLESCRYLGEVYIDSPALEVLNVRRGKLVRQVTVSSRSLQQALLSNCPVLERLDLCFSDMRMHALEGKKKALRGVRSPDKQSNASRGSRDSSDESKTEMAIKVDVGGSNSLPDWIYAEVRSLALICK